MTSASWEPESPGRPLRISRGDDAPDVSDSGGVGRGRRSGVLPSFRTLSSSLELSAQVPRTLRDQTLGAGRNPPPSGSASPRAASLLTLLLGSG